MNQVGEEAFASFFQNIYSHQAIHPITELRDSPSDHDVREEEEILAVETSTNDHVLNVVEDIDIEQRKTTSFVLSFSNLTYRVNVRRKFSFRSVLRRPTETEKKTILDDVSGEARDGEILAILGASGSGKSTLIDALANRIERRSLESGIVRLNGGALEPRLSKAITAYMMQDDVLFPMLTVEETLAFAAEFRLPRGLGKRQKRERVRSLIGRLGLSGVAGTIIGDESRGGVSGGERRRVSIGVSVIHDPVILFLDEPTSGLDSTSAFAVVKVLKNIALSGSVVVMSIHQPSYRIVRLFDELIFLSKGRTAYRGSPAELPRFLSEFGRQIPDNTNHIEFAVDLIAELESSSAADEINTLIDFNVSWQKTKSISGADQVSPPLKEALNQSLVSEGFANPFWKEILVLSVRSTTNSRRTPAIFATRLITILITGFLLSSVYWNLDESPNGVRERLGFFAFAISTAYFSSAQYLPVFIQERHVFMRETAFNAYRRSSYAVATTVTVVPSLLALSFAFSAATFSPVGLAGGLPGFAFYAATVTAAFFAGNSLAVFISGLVPNVLIGFTAVTAVSSYFLLLSGFFIVRDRIPPYWLWLHYGSLVKYSYEAAMRSEFGRGARCFATGIELFDGTPFADVAGEVKLAMLGNLSAVSCVNVTGSSCVTTGEDVLKQQGVLSLDKWVCLAVVLSWGCFYRFLFYLTLLFGSKNKRK